MSKNANWLVMIKYRDTRKTASFFFKEKSEALACRNLYHRALRAEENRNPIALVLKQQVAPGKYQSTLAINWN
jgi:hypothetical protein